LRPGLAGERKQWAGEEGKRSGESEAAFPKRDMLRTEGGEGYMSGARRNLCLRNPLHLSSSSPSCPERQLPRQPEEEKRKAQPGLRLEA
jgi:hypothetical protein